MCDNLERQYAIRKSLRQLFPVEPQGDKARHLNTLAAIVSGIVGSQKCQLPAIANKVPGPNERESRIKKFYRWLKNDAITTDIYFLPYISALLNSLPDGPLVLVMDGSEAGRGCMALVVSVIYKKRALPIAWMVVKQKKGHLTENSHLELLEEVQRLIPEGREVIFLGDGEFDGVHLLEKLQDMGWQYVCRTARNSRLCEMDRREDPEAWFSFEALQLQEGEQWDRDNIVFTQAGYGPVQAVAVWQRPYQEPIYLVTNMGLAWDALVYYRKRYGIETFFSDQKSRGFHLAQSHLSDPSRIARLLIASSLAYIWMVHVGVMVRDNQAWMRRVHRVNRCDLSFFQLGLIWIEHCLNEGYALPAGFTIPVRC